MTRRLVDILPQAVEEGERALALIQEHPETWPTYVLGTRRFILNRFPYSLVYKTDGTQSLIVAIAHAKRKPGYWTSRVR
jgi:hypothetical protein